MNADEDYPMEFSVKIYPVHDYDRDLSAERLRLMIFDGLEDSRVEVERLGSKAVIEKATGKTIKCTKTGCPSRVMACDTIEEHEPVFSCHKPDWVQKGDTLR